LLLLSLSLSLLLPDLWEMGSVATIVSFTEGNIELSTSIGVGIESV
jgi:hypothetical protein